MTQGDQRPEAPVTAPRVRAMKQRGERITMVTAYDATFARILDEAGVDVLLVGDSVGMVVAGRESTLSVTMDEMVYHCRAVARGSRRAHVVADMPFMSYQTSPEEALRNAGRLLAEGGAHAVKVEGGHAIAPAVERIVHAGIPVVGHVGLTPQSVHAMGGFRVQGRGEQAAAEVLHEAHAVADAGAYALVLEGIPAALAERITHELEIPTIGIGAGSSCNGQVLVCYDLLGLTPDIQPKFVKQYDQWYERGIDAVRRYCEEVRSGAFPGAEHSFSGTPRALKDEPERRPDDGGHTGPAQGSADTSSGAKKA